MKSSNPVFKDSLFAHRSKTKGAVMTIGGTIIKTILLLTLVAVTAVWVWSRFDIQSARSMHTLRMLLSISGPVALVLGFITPFRPNWSPITAPFYAVSQGIVLGCLSYFVEMLYPGIIQQAVPLTLCVLFSMLLLYSTGVIRVTRRFQAMVLSAMLAIMFTYLIEWLLRFVGIQIPYIHDGSILGIAFSLFVVVVAAFSLLLDFELIVQGQAHGAPKYMEWYCAYGLMVSLVWLYFRILDLLIKLSRRKNER